MSAKSILQFSITGLLLLCIDQSTAQDSWTPDWKLIWAYDAQIAQTHHIVSFDIYKDIQNNSATYYTSVDTSLRSYKDSNIHPNTTYYYRLTVRDYLGRSSNFSKYVTKSIPFIYPKVDLIQFESGTILDLNDPSFVIDKDLSAEQYKDSLNWWINDGREYFSPDSVLHIKMTGRSTFQFSITQEGIGQDTVYFTVFDPDSFWYKKKSIIHYGEEPVTQIDQDSTLTYDTEFSVYPVPYLAGEHQGIIFKNIPPSASILVYNVLGEPVFNRYDLAMRTWQWDVRNNSGRAVSPGLYIYHVLNKQGAKKHSGKLVVVR